MKKFSFVLLLLVSTVFSKIPPIAVLHGTYNSCEKADTVEIVNKLSSDFDTHVECIEMGNGLMDSVFGNLNVLAMDACEKLMENPNFQSDFSIFAISQGNLVSRYIIEKCPLKGKVINYVSFEGPHMGIGYIPYVTCGVICDWINDLWGSFILRLPIFPEFLAASSYFRPRHNNDDYVNFNTFLRDINNEGYMKNPTYKERMLQLKKVLMIKGTNDKVICPKDSSFFEFYDEKGNEIVPLEKSKFYIEDFIGIRQLNEEGRIQWVEFAEPHSQFSEEEYQKYIKPFFASTDE